jgi:hypothetical protein
VTGSKRQEASDDDAESLRNKFCNNGPDDGLMNRMSSAIPDSLASLDRRDDSYSPLYEAKTMELVVIGLFKKVICGWRLTRQGPERRNEWLSSGIALAALGGSTFPHGSQPVNQACSSNDQVPGAL